MVHQESLKKRLAKLAAPIFIETLLIMMLGAVDTIMLSRHSDSSVAAVGVVNQIIMLTFLVFEVINLGTSVLCSQYLGARLQKKVVQVVGVSLIVNVVVGTSVSLFLFSLAGPILRLMGLTPELMTDGMDYMRIVGAFAFFQAISLTLSASLRSANKAIYPMLVTVVVNILNIIGNYSLIFGQFGFPELGVEGAAISTAFSRGVSMVLLFIILFRKHIHRFPLAYFRPFPWIELKNLMKVGLPSAGEQLSYSDNFLHQYAGRRSTRHPYLLRQYHHVRLFIQHLHGTRGCHLYRSSYRGEKAACRFPDGEICDEKVCDDHRHTFHRPRRLRKRHFPLADFQ